MSVSVTRFGTRPVWASMLTVLLGVLAVAALVPTASAQSADTMVRLDLRFDGFAEDHLLANGRIMPETGVARVGINASLNVNMYNRQSTCTTPVQVDFTVKGPSYATAIVVPSTVPVVIGGGTGTSQNRWEAFPITSAHLEITVGRDAPSLADGLYEVTMKARGQPTSTGSSYNSYCDLGDSRVASATYRLKNDFIPRTSVTASNLFAKAGPNERILLPIVLENLGNGPARVTVNLQQSEANAFRSFSAGPAIRLASPLDGRGGGQSTVYVDVTTPADWGYTNRISTLTATVNTVYDGAAPGSTLQDTTNVTFSIQTEGMYASLYGLPTTTVVIVSLLSVGGIGLFAGFAAGLATRSMLVRRREKKAKRREEKALKARRREEEANEARRQDEANEARRREEEAIEARRQEEANEARRREEEAIEARRQEEANEARRREEEAIEARRQEEANEARRHAEEAKMAESNAAVAPPDGGPPQLFPGEGPPESAKPSRFKRKPKW
jgi:hypothetical protein